MTKAIPRRHMRDELMALIALPRDEGNINALHTAYFFYFLKVMTILLGRCWINFKSNGFQKCHKCGQ